MRTGNSLRHWGWISLAAVILIALLVAALLRQSGPTSLTSPSPSPSPSPTVSASPTVTASPTAPPTVAVIPSPAATSTSARRSAEDLSERLADALEASDWDRIEKLIAPTGWNAGWWRSEGTPDMTPRQAIDWLKQKTRDRRLVVTVQRRPILSSSSLPENPSRPYVTSEWREFDNGRDGRLPTQRVLLLFNADATGFWYWKTAIFNYSA
jgi:hypothetical protein